MAQDVKGLRRMTIDAELRSAEIPQRRYVDARDISFWYGTRDEIALQDVSFSVEKGQFVCILGPSGCGKSTLLSILSGLAAPKEGTVSVSGVPVWASRTNGDKEQERTEHSVPRCGYVFQDARLLPWRTVRQNLTIPMKAAGITQSEWDDRTMESLKALQIDKYVDAWPMQLSGGQRQRVAIARALSVDPAYMIMDEPFSTLDEVTARLLRTELLEVWERTGKTIIFVTHSIREAVFLADKICIMTRGPGRILETRDIDIARPRRYEDPELTQIEQNLVETVLDKWGYDKDA